MDTFKYTAFYFSVLVLITSSAAQGQDRECLCGTHLYGSPDISDCNDVLDEFANSKDNVIRVFDEEPLRPDAKGSWQGLIDIVGEKNTAQAIQLPRTYSRGASSFTPGGTNALDQSSDKW